MSMLTTEWNWDTAKRVWQDEAREEGIGVGLALCVEYVYFVTRMKIEKKRSVPNGDGLC